MQAVSGAVALILTFVLAYAASGTFPIKKSHN
jgi:hypothetical protein